ncbi:MAG: hypothetical protein HRU78_07790 [Gammaproteobacteria bacterium]|nr:MAG: hypothetical protein HRU78_07790 [Gammaproteobacteria bacterium]
MKIKNYLNSFFTDFCAFLYFCWLFILRVFCVINNDGLRQRFFAYADKHSRIKPPE